MKVIFIIPFPPLYEYKSGPVPDYYWLNMNNEKVCVWRMDRGHVFALDVKRFFPKIEYEVWRLDYRADKEYIHEFEDGVVHRSFPAQKKIYRRGLKPIQFWTSHELIEALESEVSRKNKIINTVCHRSVDFNFFSHLLLKRFAGRIPFLLTSHLNFHLLKPEIKTLHPAKYLHRLLIKKKLQAHLDLLKKTEIAVPSDRIDFFKQNTESNVHLLNSLNFDFDWVKNKINKKQAREKLGLDPNSFIIFSSSRIVPEKQLDKMLLSLSSLNDLDFKCIISGRGDRNHESYLKKLNHKLSLDSKVSFVGFLSDNLIDYYCASDVFISTSGSEAGPVSAIKAIALEKPLISTNTGMAAYLLKEYDAGVILEKNNSDTWAETIREVIQGKKINTIDPGELEKKYGLENATRQLVDYYQKAIDNFRKNARKI